MDMKQFKKQLPLLLSSGQKLQDNIHEMSCFALHCINIGKTGGVDSPMQHLWNVLVQLKGINRQAWLNWVAEFGCCRFVKLEDGTFLVKYADKAKTDKDFDAEKAVELAASIPYWEYAKEPTPNVKPFSYADAIRNVMAQGKSAATGGKDGLKPKRVIEQGELADVLNLVLNNPHFVMEKLGLLKPSEELKVPEVDSVEILDEEAFTGESLAELQDLIDRQGLRMAA